MKKLFFASFTMFLFLIYSCKKEDIAPQSIESTVEADYKKLLPSCYELTDEDIESLGQLHNNYLDAALREFDKQATDPRRELKNVFKGLQVDNTTDSEILKMLNNPYGEDAVRDHLSDNPTALSYLDRGLMTLNKAETYSELELQIDILYVAARLELSCEPQNIILLYLETLKKSAYFWLPQEIGGSGTGDAFLAATGNYQKISPEAKRIIAADAMGAGGALIGGALFANADAVICPPCFFGRVGFAAAWASGGAALF